MWLHSKTILIGTRLSVLSRGDVREPQEAQLAITGSRELYVVPF